MMIFVKFMRFLTLTNKILHFLPSAIIICEHIKNQDKILRPHGLGGHILRLQGGDSNGIRSG